MTTTPKKADSLFARLGPAGFLGIVWASLPAVAGISLLARLGPISDWIRSLDGAGVVVYVALFVLLAGLGVLPTYAQAVLAGWVFGVATGLPAALAGFTGAAVLGYAVARFVSRDRVEMVIAENAKAAAIHRALIGRGFAPTLGTVALLRLPPNAPFSLSNLVMAGSGVALAPYTLGTLIGMAPRTAVAVLFAAAGADTGAKDIQAFVKDGLGLGIFLGALATMIIVLAILAAIANRAIDRLIPPAPAPDPGGDGS